MRRILSACLLQTMRFDTSNGADPKADLDTYIRKLDKSKLKYSIEETQNEADGSLVVKIKKQYNFYSTEGYLG
jgi:hypothetical protein